MKRRARTDLPERVQYTKYYEHDGMLRAYANRAMVLAILFAVIAMSSWVLRFMFAFSLQPSSAWTRRETPPRWAVAQNRETSRRASSLLSQQRRRLQPNLRPRPLCAGFLKTIWVTRRQPLIRISPCPQHDDGKPADIFTRQTSRRRHGWKDQGRPDRFAILIRTIEPVKNAPWTYVAFGVKEIRRVRNRVESTDRIVGRYNVRLLQDRRSESNPSGLLVAEFAEQQMVGERDGDLLQQSQFSGK